MAPIASRTAAAEQDRGRERGSAYVRALDLSVTRLEQTYRRLDERPLLTTHSDGGGFQAVLEYDAAGLIVDYPGIAVRFA